MKSKDEFSKCMTENIIGSWVFSHENIIGSWVSGYGRRELVCKIDVSV